MSKNKKACKQKNFSSKTKELEAQFEVGSAYANGIGVKQNLTLASYCLNLSGSVNEGMNPHYKNDVYYDDIS